jgi:hypothetical protein
MLIGCALALILPATASAASSAALARYDSSSGHWVTTGAVTSGYTLEGMLGFLSPDSVSGTVPLYGCQEGSDHFLSLSSSCAGQTLLRTEGYIYSQPPAGLASEAVYLCLAASTTVENHFASTDPQCEGQITIGLLGYTLLSAVLSRYNGGSHWETTGTPPSGFGLEGTLGYLVSGEAGASGVSPLYGCMSSNGQFLSLDPGCGEQTTLDLEGYIYSSAPSAPGDALYSCVQNSDYFASVIPGCEGQDTVGLFGYTLQSPLTPPPAPAPPTATVPPVTSSTALPVARSSVHRRVLRVKIVLSWTWSNATSQLTRAQFGRVPAGAKIRVVCHGRGAACKSRALVAGRRGVRRLVRTLDGRVYRAGDRVSVTVSKRGYESERAVVRIRDGKLPSVSSR